MSGGAELFALIVDQDTATGLLLTGVGQVDIRKRANFLIVDDKTSQQQVEEAFKDFTTREDIAVLLINQVIAGMIRHLLDAYTKPVPAILEIPSKDAPYDPSQDSVLQRVCFMFGES
ncbi:V-type proton ATPase subunit F [Micractinium conductrix]|uniref:V-type proton ATPase subunit F n=1 Tax=Micractinium conductrix TaxID=554055 RepID=A0A2P6V9Y2_9CHLO|nr:V-type proton ATPase subunit F [Micractinium conductrix]|eukprot:PSC70903.1 V-type proton ATPase subunit F [Micractinium conductrix]